jgi:DnaJ-domain-containing protein 1
MRVMAEDLFALLGLERKFDVAAAKVQMAARKKLAALHPDRVTEPVAQAQAARDSARINQAAAVLTDDEQRANHLLTLLGDPQEHAKSLPDGFLLEMMDVRQDMEQALASGDAAERARIETWAEKERRRFRDLVNQLFDTAGPTPSADQLREIRLQLNAWRYIERMIEQLDPAYRGL